MSNIPEGWILDEQRQRYYRCTVDANGTFLLSTKLDLILNITGQSSSEWVTDEEIAQNEMQLATTGYVQHKAVYR